MIEGARGPATALRGPATGAGAARSRGWGNGVATETAEQQRDGFCCFF